MSSLILTLALVAGNSLRLVSAGGVTEAKCNVTSVVSWSYNKEGQSPCQVAANLSAICSSTSTYDIPPLNPAFGSYYTPSSAVTPCECSSVVYTLAAACGLCQGAGYTNWPSWTMNCSSVSPGTFPFSIPQGTYVPKWAYMDVNSTNTFNPSIAQSIGDTPESKASAPTSSARPSSTNHASLARTDTQVPASTASNMPPPSNTEATSDNNHAGAIAGGVVGGILGFAIIAAIAFYFTRKSVKHRISNISPPILPNDEKDYSIPAPCYNSPRHLVTRPNSAPLNGSNSKRYDPHDSSTHPRSPAQFSNHSAPSHYVSSNYGTPFTRHQHPGSYSGVAEI